MNSDLFSDAYLVLTVFSIANVRREIRYLVLLLLLSFDTSFLLSAEVKEVVEVRDDLGLSRPSMP